MLQQIALWLLDWLRGRLDPDLQKRIDAFKEKVKAVEAEEARILGEIEAGKLRLVELSLVIAESNRKRIELENAILHAKEVAAAKIAELDALHGDDRLRVDF